MESLNKLMKVANRQIVGTFRAHKKAAEVKNTAAALF
jgi:hypothetical protein